MSKIKLPPGEYTGHWEHFENQPENCFVFIIDEADDDSFIGKGMCQQIDSWVEKNNE